jgi:hypothetical protein
MPHPKRPSPAMIVALLALICALCGSALAATQLAKNSVGSRQLKEKAVSTGKLANNAVNGAKVANGSLTGEDINLAALGTVPAATKATQAANADTVAGHAAACPQATTLIGGICFDSAPNGLVESPQEAADACQAKGGWLPAPLELYATRQVINLGTGVGSDSQYTAEIYANTNGTAYRTVLVDGTGTITEVSAEGNVPEHYVCAYALLR